MKKLLALLAMLPTLAFAQTPFDGSWVANLDTAQPSKRPHVYLLDKGMYSCTSCIPKIKVKADGQDQKVSGSHYFDSVSIHAVDDNTVEEVDKKDGKVVYKDTSTVSNDGKTLTDKFEDDSESKPATGETILTRISNGPAGSHAISGSWRTEKLKNFSSNAMTVQYAGTADGLKMSDTNGLSYDAKFDGKDYPTEGDPGHTMVSLKKVDANTIEETDKRDGKVVAVIHMSVAADGKSMKLVINDKERNATSTYTLEKKS
jgi:hypothetical protein